MLKNGDNVFVRNTSLGGETIIEGRARILKPIHNRKDHYLVEFYSDIGCQQPLT